MMYRGRSGISPVVATVILVAIAIVIAIAVAFWATGLVGIFTRYEKLEITSAYARTSDGGEIEVVLRVRNTGSADTSIDEIFVNGVPCETECEIEDISIGGGSVYTLRVGDSAEIIIKNPPSRVTNNEWVSGITYEVTVHTASGKSYPAAVLIP